MVYKMKKKFNFIDENFQEEFMSIFAIGLTQCLEQKLIDTKRAEQWLFSPMVAYNLKSEGYDKKFLYAMEYASELDATRDADYFLNSVKTAQKLFTEVLNEINKVTIASGEHIIEGLCELE
jgi:hypothetical protein